MSDHNFTIFGGVSGLSELLSKISKISENIKIETPAQQVVAPAPVHASNVLIKPEQSPVEIPAWVNQAKTPIPYDFDMKKTTRKIIKKLTKFGEIVKENPDVYELESRLIKRVHGSRKVLTDVDEVIFNKIMKQYVLQSRHYDFIPWYNIHDTYYPDDVRFRQTWTTGSTEIKKEWVRKTIIENSDWIVDNRPLSIRISLKKEKPIEVSATSLQSMVPTNFIKKKTCCFKDRAVTIFFSYIWEGETEEKASISLPKRSIEVEVNNEIVKSPDMTADAIVGNLIFRTVELQGTNEPMSLAEVLIM